MAPPTCHLQFTCPYIPRIYLLMRSPKHRAWRPARMNLHAWYQGTMRAWGMGVRPIYSQSNRSAKLGFLVLSRCLACRARPLMCYILSRTEHAIMHACMRLLPRTLAASIYPIMQIPREFLTITQKQIYYVTSSSYFMLLRQCSRLWTPIFILLPSLGFPSCSSATYIISDQAS
jgi:hypothetical protein